jgi:MFS family permease
MIDLKIFRAPQLTAAASAMTIAFMAMTGAMFLVVQSLQIVKGYSPLTAALATSGPLMIVNFILMPRSPGLTERYGARWMISAGSLLIAASALIIAMTTVHSGYANLFVGFAVMATAFSLFVPASTEAIMTAVPKETAGGASAINQTARQVGQALGIAIGGSIAASGYTSGFVSAALPLGPAQLHRARSSITGAIEVAHNLAGSARHDVLLAADQAFLHGIRWSLVSASALAIMGATFAAVAVPSHRVLKDQSPLPSTASTAEPAPDIN